MALTIDEGKCIGCGDCVGICPNEALAMVDGLSKWARPDICELCAICEAICQHGAIEVTVEAADTA